MVGKHMQSNLSWLCFCFFLVFFFILLHCFVVICPMWLNGMIFYDVWYWYEWPNVLHIWFLWQHQLWWNVLEPLIKRISPLGPPCFPLEVHATSGYSNPITTTTTIQFGRGIWWGLNIQSAKTCKNATTFETDKKLLKILPWNHSVNGEKTGEKN